MENETVKPTAPVSPVQGFEMGITGGAKAGYFALGFFLGLIGVLITYLVNKDKTELAKKGAMKFCIIGLVTVVVISVITTVGSYAYLMSMVGSYGMM